MSVPQNLVGALFAVSRGARWFRGWSHGEIDRKTDPQATAVWGPVLYSACFMVDENQARELARVLEGVVYALIPSRLEP